MIAGWYQVGELRKEEGVAGSGWLKRGSTFGGDPPGQMITIFADHDALVMGPCVRYIMAKGDTVIAEPFITYHIKSVISEGDDENEVRDACANYLMDMTTMSHQVGLVIVWRARIKSVVEDEAVLDATEGDYRKTGRRIARARCRFACIPHGATLLPAEEAAAA